MSDKVKKLVEALVACERSPFTEEDREMLGKKSEDQLTQLAAAFEPPEPQDPPKPKADDPPPAEPPADEVRLSREEYEAMKASSAAWAADQKARKGALVASLKDRAKGYTEAELQAKPIEDLRALAKSLEIDEPAVRDYGGQGGPVTRGDEPTAAPKPWTNALKRRHQSASDDAPAN